MNLETIKEGLKYYKKYSGEGTEFRDVCIMAENLLKELEKKQLSLTDVVSSKRLNLVVFEDYTRCYKVSDKELEQLKKDGDIEDGDIVCKVEVIKEY